jgi:hypothetical protein
VRCDASTYVLMLITSRDTDIYILADTCHRYVNADIYMLCLSHDTLLCTYDADISVRVLVAIIYRIYGDAFACVNIYGVPMRAMRAYVRPMRQMHGRCVYTCPMPMPIAMPMRVLSRAWVAVNVRVAYLMRAYIYTRYGACGRSRCVRTVLVRVPCGIYIYDI